ncbi:AAA family ATPase [Pacificoceanicola onchidii]|uniref:AAA family ATPase n=1 Tax=Pacificoceanicola onchidii TaxID=2562685 RepID=UPI001F107B9B|nr:AAA family ATPase [Pacificoceanicola onchidii]
MKRVMIVGQPGSGKSTLARMIGDRTGLPVVHVDRIHHLPGWQERPRDEKIAMAMAEQAKPIWVFEGGLSATWEHRFSRADTYIFLDFPLHVRAWRVFWRTIRHYGRTRPDMQENCPERFNWEFTKWIWDTRHTGRRKPLALLQRVGPGKTGHHLRNAAQVRAFLSRLDEAGVTGLEARHDSDHNRTARPQG